MIEHNIIGDVLFQLQLDHLKEMGIQSVADRMKMLILFRRLKVESTKQFLISASVSQQSFLKSKTLSKEDDNEHQDQQKPNIPSAQTEITPSKQPDAVRSIFGSGGNNNNKQPQRNNSIASKQSSLMKNGSSENLSTSGGIKIQRRVIKVFADNDQSRIIDTTEVATLRDLYLKILNKFSVQQKTDKPLDMESEMEKWEIVFYTKKQEGRPLIETDVTNLGSAPSSGPEDKIPRFKLRLRTHSLDKSKKAGAKKYTKLENFFGEKMSAVNKGNNASTPKPAPSKPSTPNQQENKVVLSTRPPSEHITGNLSKFFPSIGTKSKPAASPTPPSPQTPSPRPHSPATVTAKSQESGSNDSLPSSFSKLNRSFINRQEKEIKWSKGQLLGTGSFGNVYMGLNMNSGEIIAVKQVVLPDDSQDLAASGAPAKVKIQQKRKQMVDSLQREIGLLRELEHANIVKYLGSESTDEFLNIFLEYVPGGSIASALASYGVFEENLIRSYVRQILTGLMYLHEKNIIHRDIKSANILIDNNGIIKITDFGISKKMPGGQDRGSVISLYSSPAQQQNRSSALQGSIFWMSPEVVKHYHYSKKSDVWATACVIIEMLTGDRPWPNMPQMAALFKIGNGEHPEIPTGSVSPALQLFLDDCFIFNYKKRPSATALMSYEFIVTTPVDY